MSIPILDRLRESVRARSFLDGVNVAAVSLIAVVAGQLAMTAMRDLLSVGEAVVGLALLGAGVGTGRLIIGGAIVGLIRLAWIPL